MRFVTLCVSASLLALLFELSHSIPFPSPRDAENINSNFAMSSGERRGMMKERIAQKAIQLADLRRNEKELEHEAELKRLEQEAKRQDEIIALGGDPAEANGPTTVYVTVTALPGGNAMPTSTESSREGAFDDLLNDHQEFPSRPTSFSF
ncbi:MAG: hypothetical protein DHS80DRAFT_25583 [Piptocephalis tieghemiana]|nr:MAG: hypothetical protein DHS80DRAFT_25583 [Piptocephalis tieghemiana]